MINLLPRENGVLLPVRARAGGKQNELRAPVDGYLRIVVTQAAEQGKANQSIAKLLAKTLGLRKSQIELSSGATSRTKMFLVREITVAELRDRIRAALAR